MSDIIGSALKGIMQDMKDMEMDKYREETGRPKKGKKSDMMGMPEKGFSMLIQIVEPEEEMEEKGKKKKPGMDEAMKRILGE